MKPYKKQIFTVNKASDSTTASNITAESTVISEATKGVNNNTALMTNMMVQLNSTKMIAIIIIVGLFAYLFISSKKGY